MKEASQQQHKYSHSKKFMNYCCLILRGHDGFLKWPFKRPKINNKQMQISKGSSSFISMPSLLVEIQTLQKLLT